MECLDLCNNLIFPLLYTIAGAIVGGVFALKIANKHFSTEVKSKAQGFILLERAFVDEMRRLSIEMCNDIDKMDAEKTTDYYYTLRDKDVRMDALFCKFTEQWFQCEGNISLCGMEFFVKRKNERNFYQQQTQCIQNILPLIKIYRQHRNIFNASIDDDSIKLKILSPERMQLLKSLQSCLSDLALECEKMNQIEFARTISFISKLI